MTGRKTELKSQKGEIGGTRIVEIPNTEIAKLNKKGEKMRLSEQLRKRTKQYAATVIRLFVKLPIRRKEVQVVGEQLLRSGTSVAAHVREASRARSNAEFCSKIDGALQEADESGLWLELLQDDCGIRSDELVSLLGETNELIAIFTTMMNKTKSRIAD